MSPDRVPPHDAEAELAVLGSLLLITDRAEAQAIFAIVAPSDFYRGPHATVFRAQLDLWEGTGACDAVLLRRELQETGHLETVGGTSFLSRIIASVPTAANAGHYARIVRQASLERQVLLANVEHDVATRESENGSAQAALQRVVDARAALEAFLHPPPPNDGLDDLATSLALPDPGPPEEFVARTFTRPSTNIIYGASGSGKSFATMAMCLDAIDGGGSFMGVPDLAIRPVGGAPDVCLWIYGSEDTERRIRSRARQIRESGPHRQIPLETDRFLYAPPPGGISINSLRGRRWLENTIKTRGVTILVLDTVTSVAPDLDPNKAEQVIPFLVWINRLRAEHNLVIFLVHHTRKSSTDPKASTASKADTLLGSQVWRSQTESVVMIDAKDGNALDTSVRVVKAKDIDNPPAAFRASLSQFTGRFAPLADEEEAPQRQAVERSAGGRPPKFSADLVLALRPRFPSGLDWNRAHICAILKFAASIWFDKRAAVEKELLERNCVVVHGVLRWPDEPPAAAQSDLPLG